MKSISKILVTLTFLVTACLVLYLNCGDNSTEPAPCYTLTVGTSGSGTVTVSPDSSCYHNGTNVTLTAIADTGWAFDEWSGDATGAENPVTITIGEANVSVTATFSVEEYTLTIDIDPENGGSVTQEPDQETYNYGDTVTLTAVPEEFYVFNNWTGDATGDNDTLELIIEGNTSVTANFSFGTLEGEPDCGHNYDDSYNGGCNSDPNVFQSITSGQAILGTSGTFLYEGYDYRDTDWFEYEATDNVVLIWKGVAEFPILLFIFDGTPGCDFYVNLADSIGEPDDTVTVSALVEPGTYWMWVGPQVFGDTPYNCPVDYTVWFTAEPIMLSEITNPARTTRHTLGTMRPDGKNTEFKR